MNKALGTRVREIRDSLLAALSSAGVAGIDILTAPVTDFRPIDWRTPPIKPFYELGGVAPSLIGRFGGITKYPHVDPSRVYDQTLSEMRYDVTRALTVDGSYMRAGTIFDIPAHAIKLAFSTPESVDGYPPGDAGAIFALEFAACLCSAGIGELVISDSDYYVAGRGFAYGVRDGRPIGHEDTWDADIGGSIPLYLSAPRGVSWTTYSLDAIDRVYFWYDSLAEKPPELEGLVDALCILRTLDEPSTTSTFERYLYTSRARTKKEVKVEISPIVVQHEKLSEALAVMFDWSYTDEQRISRLAELLVPHVMPEGTFNRRIWNLNRPVRFLSPREVKKIAGTLERLKLGTEKYHAGG